MLGDLVRHAAARVCLAAGLVVWASAVTPALAADLAMPTGRVVLTVTGKIANTNAPGAARFDAAMLEALGVRTTRTKTPWHEGVVTFEGPLGRALLDKVGATGSTMAIVALNDYAVDVPIADFRDNDVILAMKRDGKVMDVRDRGPIFVIYPFDRNPELWTEKYFNRSAWQVKSIEVK